MSIAKSWSSGRRDPGRTAGWPLLVTLRETGWVVAGPKGAAARLGMKRSTLQEKMKKLGISRPQ
jgi:transcriptional regulator with GAF, ATPase, and Fis domain